MPATAQWPCPLSVQALDAASRHVPWMTSQSRRAFLRQTALAALAPAFLMRAPFGAHADDVIIIDFSDTGVRKGPVRVPVVVKSEAAWRKQLTPMAFVTREAGTERSFTGEFWNLHDAGLFRCICCDTALFNSLHKFDSGTGWPSFWQPIAAENVVGPARTSPHADATEVTCRRCRAHLGDIFDDGPKPTGLRYCIDSASLRFVRR
jgi:peptide-methionine (R)-S-oxide reductase